QVAILNNSQNNYSMTKLTTTFVVTPSNNLFHFAYAGIFSGGLNCCTGTGLYIKMSTCNNTPISCGEFTLGPACNNSGTVFNQTGGSYWTSWVTKTVNLTAYIGN